MKKIMIFAVVLTFGLVSGNAGEKKNEIPYKGILKAGEELKIPVDGSKAKRIIISVSNLLDEESVFYRSEYKEGKERPENEIGPKKFRTTTLNPKVTDENATVRLDKKEIVLDTGNLDELYLKVEKGNIEIEIKAEKKKI